MNKLTLVFSGTEMSVWQLPADHPVPAFILDAAPPSGFTRTKTELSILCQTADVPDDAKGKIESGWIYFYVEGALDFGLTGILASIANPLAEAGISIFAVSTYDTDYVLIKKENADKARQVLGQHFIILDKAG